MFKQLVHYTLHTYEKHKRNSNDQIQIILFSWLMMISMHTRTHTNSKWTILFHLQFGNTLILLWKASPTIKLNDCDSKNQRNEGQLVSQNGGWWMMALLWYYLKGSILSIHPLFHWIRHDWICFYVISVLPFSINWTDFITCVRCSQYQPTNNIQHTTHLLLTEVERLIWSMFTI